VIDLRCPCGQRIGFRHRAIGFEHVGVFFDLGTGLELELCPCCWSDLHEAYIEGQLTDVDELA
jgi:hypothetical protein